MMQYYPVGVFYAFLHHHHAEKTGVAFSFARYSTTPIRANVNTCPIYVHPLGMQYILKLCTVEPQGHRHTQIGILFVYTPHVYWKMVVYQNVTLVKQLHPIRRSAV